MDGMNLNEALNVVSQMRNHFKAFEKLHLVIEEVVRFEQTKKERERTLGKLDSMIKEKRGVIDLELIKVERAKLVEELQSLKEDEKEQLEKVQFARHELAQVRSEVDAEVAKAQEEGERKKEHIRKDLEEAEEKFQKTLKVHESELARLTLEEVEVKSRLEKYHKDIAKLRAKLEGE